MRTKSIGGRSLSAALALACLTSTTPTFADTVYLWKSYSGGLFWSSGHCNKRQATIERIESVPDGLPWNQQVSIAEQQWARARGLHQPPNLAAPGGPAGIGPNPECAILDAEISRLDSLARQPHSGSGQDEIAVRRKAARDKQFRLRCR